MQGKRQAARAVNCGFPEQRTAFCAFGCNFPKFNGPGGRGFKISAANADKLNSFGTIQRVHGGFAGLHKYAHGRLDGFVKCRALRQGVFSIICTSQSVKSITFIKLVKAKLQTVRLAV